MLVAKVGGLPLALVLLGSYLSNPEWDVFREGEQTQEKIKVTLKELHDPLIRLKCQMPHVTVPGIAGQCGSCALLVKLW